MSMRRWWFGVLALALACGDDDGTIDADGGADGGPGACASSAECDDGQFCNGAEICDPAASGADARGCVARAAPCLATQICDEAANECTSECAVESDMDGDGADAIACGGTDCDDTDPRRNPDATEVCDLEGLDEDCDDTTFGDRDADGDGFVSLACCNGTNCGEDCDDSRRGANPDAPEVCDTVDNDCDGAIDEEVLVRCYVDGDGDGYALPGASSLDACECPVRTTARPPDDESDCDDTRADRNPANPEVCSNGGDDDCDGTVDEAGNDWYRDCDGDGYGTGTAVRQCVSPGTPSGCPGGGHVLVAGDCDDGNAVVFPGAPERCDGIRNDCRAPAADGAPATAWCNGPAAPSPLPNSDYACQSGSCVLLGCDPSFLDCTSAAGCESDSRTDAAHCGECGLACEPADGPAACSGGRCRGWTQISPGGSHTCALRPTGGVLCWGENDYGEVGDGTEIRRATPVTVSGLADAVEIAAGADHHCARRSAGTVVCWGRGGEGQLGNGSMAHSGSPSPVSGLTDAVEVDAHEVHTCARRASGAVVCWGWNSSGQLGDGTTTTRTTPNPVPGVSDAVEIATGALHSCARRATGTVLCWGANFQGQLGDGTLVNHFTPAPVTGLTDAISVAAGEDHTCALRATGEVVCWGRDSGGSLPTPVTGLTDAVEITAGERYTCVRRATGAVACWGTNARGQLGDGTTTPRTTPTPVVGLSDAVEVAAGEDHTCARRRTGATVCWGSDRNRQLGDGDDSGSDRLVPTQVVPWP